MPPRLVQPPSEAANSDMILGEIRGQLREVVHSVNGLTQKFDGLTREVVALAVIGTEVAAMKIKIEALETKGNLRDGADGVIVAVMRSPLLGWIVGAIITAFAVAKGWVKVP